MIIFYARKFYQSTDVKVDEPGAFLVNQLRLLVKKIQRHQYKYWVFETLSQD